MSNPFPCVCELKPAYSPPWIQVLSSVPPNPLSSPEVLTLGVSDPETTSHPQSSLNFSPPSLRAPGELEKLRIIG